VTKHVGMLVRLAWCPQAACAGAGPDVFFDPEPEAQDAARAICGSCRVRGACGAWAIAQAIRESIFGA
jgi:hypothetical protein